jgi:hypothetical protein
LPKAFLQSLITIGGEDVWCDRGQAVIAKHGFEVVLAGFSRRWVDGRYVGRNSAAQQSSAFFSNVRSGPDLWQTPEATGTRAGRVDGAPRSS